MSGGSGGKEKISSYGVNSKNKEPIESGHNSIDLLSNGENSTRPTKTYCENHAQLLFSP